MLAQIATQARVLLAVDDLARDTAQAWIEVRRYEQLRQIAREQTRGVTAIHPVPPESRQRGPDRPRLVPGGRQTSEVWPSPVDSRASATNSRTSRDVLPCFHATTMRCHQMVGTA